MSTKETMKEAGYRYGSFLGNRQHCLVDLETGNSEIWASNKNHAGYGIKYKNTHLEFCSQLPL